MQDLLNKLGRVASNAASNASSKAEELREINKLKGEQSDKKKEYTTTKRKLADYVFKRFQEDDLEDENLKEFCRKLRDLRDEIDGIDEEIKQVRADFEEKAAQRAEENNRL